MLHDFPVQVLVKRYPSLTVVADRLLDIYCQLTGDRHPSPAAAGVSSSHQVSEAEQQRLDEGAAALEGRGLCLRCYSCFFSFTLHLQSHAFINSII